MIKWEEDENCYTAILADREDTDPEDVQWTEIGTGITIRFIPSEIMKNEEYPDDTAVVCEACFDKKYWTKESAELYTESTVIRCVPQGGRRQYPRCSRIATFISGTGHLITYPKGETRTATIAEQLNAVWKDKRTEKITTADSIRARWLLNKDALEGVTELPIPYTGRTIRLDTTAEEACAELAFIEAEVVSQMSALGDDFYAQKGKEAFYAVDTVLTAVAAAGVADEYHDLVLKTWPQRPMCYDPAEQYYEDMAVSVAAKSLAAIKENPALWPAANAFANHFIFRAGLITASVYMKTGGADEDAVPSMEFYSDPSGEDIEEVCMAAFSAFLEHEGSLIVEEQRPTGTFVYGYVNHGSGDYEVMDPAYLKAVSSAWATDSSTNYTFMNFDPFAEVRRSGRNRKKSWKAGA